MDYQFAEAVSDLQIGDIIEIDGKKGELYNLRMIQQIRDGKVWFEYKLKTTDWVKRKQVKVIKYINRRRKKS
jgi:hypothetical protein